MTDERLKKSAGDNRTNRAMEDRAVTENRESPKMSGLKCSVSSFSSPHYRTCLPFRAGTHAGSQPPIHVTPSK